MARPPPVPGTLARRYDELTGGPDRRRTLYYARRLLNLSRAEWDALPWHDQRTYLEGMDAELTGSDSGGHHTSPAAPSQHYPAPQVVEQTTEPVAPAGDDPAGAGDRPSWLNLPIKQVAAFGDSAA